MRRSMMENPAGEGGVRCASDWRHSPDYRNAREKTPPLLGAGECVTQAIRVELSERHRRSGDTVPVAACYIATVESSSSPICKLARKLLHLGVDARTQLSIWRGKTKCFDDVPVGCWAELTVDEGGAGTVFRRYKPFPGRAVVSQGAKSDA